MTDLADAADSTELDNYIEFRPNGGMHLVEEGRKRRLRSPRLREYRKLSELWNDEATALEARSQDLGQFIERVQRLSQERMERGEPALTEEDRAEDRRLGREVREATEDATLRWWVECIRTLGVTPADCEVEMDDLPVFLTNSESITQAIQHWRSVPSRSGAR